MFHEIQLFLELKLSYLRRFWSFIDLGIIVCPWTSVCIYVWRYQELRRISDLFEKTNGFVYINELFTSLLAFCCFFGTINTFFGSFYFSLFIILVVFVCISMFLTIINESFRIVRDQKALREEEDQQIFLFMFH
ncbi:hypothetical protein I4U23_020480 [Adineta vaga]|nr:hypothetical protein I4U23_020480 [Adineta vaga]